MPDAIRVQVRRHDSGEHPILRFQPAIADVPLDDYQMIEIVST